MEIDQELIDSARRIHRNAGRRMGRAWGRAEVLTQRRGWVLELSSAPVPDKNEWSYLAVAVPNDGTSWTRYSYISLDAATALDGLADKLEDDDAAST